MSILAATGGKTDQFCADHHFFFISAVKKREIPQTLLMAAFKHYAELITEPFQSVKTPL